MPSLKTSGIILLVGGIILVLVSLFADNLRMAGSVGLAGHAGLGMYQIIALIVGLIVAGVGLFLFYKK